jgi:2-haloacid dehalogenase
MTTRAVVFDIPGVLVEWRPERLYARLIADEAQRARFLREICPPGWTAPFDRGAPTPEGVEAHALAHPAEAELIRAWWSRWPEMFGPAIPGAAALLRALKAAGRPTFGLSDFPAETFEIARRLYPFLDRLDLVVTSAQVGAIKPEPAIYAALEARCGFAPEALLLVDAGPASVAAARARGWRAHLHRGVGGLTRALTASGLLAPHQLPRVPAPRRAPPG